MGRRQSKKFEILVKYLNGEKMKVDASGYDVTDYNDMQKLYAITRDNHVKRNISCHICFFGVYPGGKRILIFKKEITTQEAREFKEYIKRQSITVRESIRIIKEHLNDLEVKKEEFKNIMSITDKEENVILHQIEGFKNAKGSQEELLLEKIKLFDELSEVRIRRRMAKNNFYDCREILSKIDVEDLMDKLKLEERKSFDYLTKKKAEQLKIMEKVKYKSHVDKAKKLKKLNNKYSKVINDAANMTLVCYNFAK